MREFCELAFACADLPLRWEGIGSDEVGIGPDGNILVEIDPHYFRPTEVDLLLGDSSKAESVLGWRSTTSFADLVSIMMDADFAQEAMQQTNSAQSHAPILQA